MVRPGCPAPLCRYSPSVFVFFSTFLLAARPFQFFTLGCIFALLSSSPRLAGRRGGTQSPTDSNHRLHLCEEGRGGEGGRKNQYNTKQWLIGLGVCCAERSLLYIMYGGRLMVSVLADKWTVSISPCVSIARRGEGRCATQALTQKADKRTRTSRPAMGVNKCWYACLYALAKRADGGSELF